MADTYTKVLTFETKNAIVRVHIPDLTADEKSRRLEDIKTAAANLLKEC